MVAFVSLVACAAQPKHAKHKAVRKAKVGTSTNDSPIIVTDGSAVVEHKTFASFNSQTNFTIMDANFKAIDVTVNGEAATLLTAPWLIVTNTGVSLRSPDGNQIVVQFPNPVEFWFDDTNKLPALKSAPSDVDQSGDETLSDAVLFSGGTSQHLTCGSTPCVIVIDYCTTGNCQ
jgi:hypothetical protein